MEITNQQLGYNYEGYFIRKKILLACLEALYVPSHKIRILGSLKTTAWYVIMTPFFFLVGLSIRLDPSPDLPG